METELTKNIFDVGIIGCGIAGMAAAKELLRLDPTRSILIVNKETLKGGQAKGGDFLWEGISKNTTEYLLKMNNDIFDAANVQVAYNKVEYLAYHHGLIIMQCYAGVNYFCKTLILATGTELDYEELPTPLPQYEYHAIWQLFGTGVYYNQNPSLQVLNSLKGKAAVLSGSSPIECCVALDMAEYCKDVYMVDTCFELEAEKSGKNFADLVNARTNIHWLPNCKIDKIVLNRQKRISAVNLSTGETIKCSAVGRKSVLKPNNKYVNNLAELDENGFIKTNAYHECGVPGIFAVGTCTGPAFKSARTVEIEGQVAGSNAHIFLRDHFKRG